MNNLERDRSRITDLAFYGLASYIPGLLSLIGVYLFVRLTSAEEYGYFSLWSTTVLMLSSVVSISLRQGLLRFWKEYERGETADLFCSTACFLTLAACVGLAGVALVAHPFLKALVSPALVQLYWLGVFAAILLNVESVQLSFWQADFRSGIYASMRVGASILTVIVSLLLLNHGRLPGSVSLSSGLVISAGVVAVLASFGLRRRGRLVFSRFDRGIAQRIAGFGAPFVGWYAGQYVSSMSSRYALGILDTVATVGVYTAAYSLIHGLVSFVGTPLVHAGHPEIVAAWVSGDDDNAAVSVLSRYLRMFALVALPILGGLIGARSLVLEAFLPATYHQGGWFVVVLAVGSFANVLSLLTQKGLEMAEKTTRLFHLSVVGAAVAVLLNWAMIPPLGLVGAALATMLTHLLYVALTVWQSRSYLKFTLPKETLIRGGVASVGVYLVAEGLQRCLWRAPQPLQLAIIGALGAFVYASLLIILGEISLDLLRIKIMEAIKDLKSRAEAAP